ncbi:MAG: lamin tail domain-containing protein, partial [Caldilineaceae bacterium]|nr:lamin tail domain-containing protein [Caldilineaceae bacterium]
MAPTGTFSTGRFPHFAFVWRIVLAIAVGGIPLPSPAYAQTDAVVISQIYGGGGNSGATFTHDFVELFNPGPDPVVLTGWSVQYAKADGAN